ncbi:MAG: glycosyltransferase family 2 protein [Candidatus Eisenbacteria bacterium]|uniref:Glycosyltransferase family 2 protein n=1 Tax=Eiseniibacteriota bacterium TaxID=2212470 RepID=A0A9D6L9Y8_UNCEI|nr:glycosyltransferase family 2 protein [Candidatus Eisenbacteria bacterium]
MNDMERGAGMKRLAVVILNWNGLADTRAALASLARCTAPAGWSVQRMVVDNGSTDGSAEALRREFPDVDVVALGENRRFAGGNNRGLGRALAAGADAIMLLNNDTEADPALLARLVEAMERAPRSAVAPLIDFFAPRDRIWYAGARLVPALGLAQHRGLRDVDRGQHRDVAPTGYLTGCCMLAPRAAWEEVGLLDERFFLYAEDSDWSLRARAAGWTLLFVPQAKLWHKVSASSGAASPWKIYQRLRANLTLFATHARGVARVTWLPCFIVQQKILFLWLLARGRGRAAWAIPRAFVDAARGRPAAEVPA